VPNYIYNSSNELTSNSSGSYTYDANGNTLTDVSGRSFTWDFENRLTQAVVPGTNGGTTTFKYDPFGRRIQKSGPLGTTNYLYDGYNGIEEVDNLGNVLARYAQGSEFDEELSELRSGTTSYYQADALGSITSLSNSTGALVSSYAYDSYGNVTASTGTLTNPFQYTGREFDSETGLYYNRARYYDRNSGRFISEDPIGFSGSGPNLYGYVANNPIDLTDPSGLTWGSNWKYFWDWALGRGKKDRNYGPQDQETWELMFSPGAERVRDAFYKSTCNGARGVDYGTYEAYWDTVADPLTADWSNTAAEVGGFGGASAVNNGNDTVTITIPNTSGTHSFFLHLVPDRKSPTGWGSNINQVFTWTEPIDNTRCGCGKK
jgi:RHS repeat-associated protein